MSKSVKKFLQYLLRLHSHHSWGMNFRWVNRETGELQTSLFWCIISSMYDRAAYGCNTFRWQRLRDE